MATESIATVQGNTVHKYAETGAIALNETTEALDQASQFNGLTLNLDIAPVAAEDFTITLDSRNGAAYDTVLFALDLSVAPVTDLVLNKDDIDLILFRGDALVVTWANTNTRTWGLELTLVEAA